jgi:uncharacterized protein YndB with AHSA1/START domain
VGAERLHHPVCELDARPQGAIRINMTGPDGTVYPMGGTVHEVASPEKFVFTSTAFVDDKGNSLMEVHNTVTFMVHNNRTKLTLQANVVKSAPEVAKALDGMEEGWTQSLDRLEELLDAEA